MTIRFFALALAFILPAAAQSTAPAPSVVPSTPPVPVDQIQLNVARNGNEVLISWVLPPAAEIKQFEILRNTRNQAPGRGRVAAVRTEPAVFYDAVPEAGTTYWYWLKITFMSGYVLNVGPIPTPDAKVWAP